MKEFYKKLKPKILMIIFSNNKLKRLVFKVQVYITMSNYEIKSYKGRFPVNKSNLLCIFEVNNKIVCAFACIYMDK